MGKSWGPVLAGQAESPRTDRSGLHGIRQGDWKLRWEYKSIGKGEWELFNLAADPAEPPISLRSAPTRSRPWWGIRPC